MMPGATPTTRTPVSLMLLPNYEWEFTAFFVAAYTLSSLGAFQSLSEDMLMMTPSPFSTRILPTACAQKNTPLS